MFYYETINKRFCYVIEWKDNYFEKIKKTILPLDCPEQSFHRESDIKKYLKILHGQSAIIEKYKNRVLLPISQ
ncbi:MAG: hypothetical protein HCAMLNBO_01387 [Candidatus Brocadia fulgida]|nr:hypothetical protein [Candidatus Brocadia fulgida]